MAQDDELHMMRAAGRGYQAELLLLTKLRYVRSARQGREPACLPADLSPGPLPLRRPRLLPVAHGCCSCAAAPCISPGSLLHLVHSPL